MPFTDDKCKRLTLYHGELKSLAANLGRSTSTLSRLFSGDRPSKSLSQEVYDKTGFWPWEIEVKPYKRPMDARAKAA
jgi:hypothetical protein